MLKGKERNSLIVSSATELITRVVVLERQNAPSYLIEDVEQKAKIYEKVIENEQLLAKKQDDGR